MPRASPVTGTKYRTSSIKPRKARGLIRQFHTLQKRRAQLETRLREVEATQQPKSTPAGNATGSNGRSSRRGDVAAFKKPTDTVAVLRAQLAEVEAALESAGGLKTYQEASISGQQGARGGDSSRLLVQWLQTNSELPVQTAAAGVAGRSLLEVGSLDVRNACATSGLFEHIDRIDLNSQNPLIEQQDFMARPVPGGLLEMRYAALSLSLVLNYVPDPAARGEMLRRTTQFIRTGGLLFFVLPEPCVSNSRYCTRPHVEALLSALGYEVRKYKHTSKLVYWLLALERPVAAKLTRPFPKKEINPGPGRNNFCIVLEPQNGGTRGQ